jgi:caffeoyl-CoA O-methyltransferase
MEELIRRLTEYCQKHTTPPSPVLMELERETHLKTLAPQMISGRLQGQLLSLLSKLMRPSKVLEIGTFTGYAAICLAQGLPDDGELHTIEANPELEYLIRKYVRKAGLDGKIHLHMGQAQEIIPILDGPFDIVFIDAGKTDYALYYNMVMDKVAPGGLILADNVLWSGKVLESEMDADTRALHAFNEMVQADDRVENLLAPLRDGLMIARKVEER